MSKIRTRPTDVSGMPGGIPYIISNEAAERFSFYGMKAALAVFLANYLGVLGGSDMSEAKTTSYVAFFTLAVYFTPLFGALIADTFFGKYRTIITLSIVYCLGHLCLAFMGVGGIVGLWLLAGLGLIAIGAGGIKPCVSAHVGDQFGKNNQHLLPRIFNIFYFSINFGAVVSNLLIPVVLKWAGPHWAFGIPGVLMTVATIFFWMGRRKFIHIPAKGEAFLRELTSKEGRNAIGKLLPMVLFVGIFWCLFDQTASRFVFQAERMNRNFFGVEVLPSQIQAFNPFFILILIPLFIFVIYPFVEKKIKLTPLRKIGAGLAIMVASFAVVALAQEAIDRGETPHVAWQLLSYLILTAAEIMVSIVGLEFFYTQAPKRMKSLMMAIFLVSVSLGNAITGLVSIYIQVPEVAVSESAHPGHDGKLGSDDDLIKADDVIRSPVTDLLKDSADRVVATYITNGKLPLELADPPKDPWGNPLRYTLQHAKKARVTSDGPDGKNKTKWDLGITLTLIAEESAEKGTWLYKAKSEQGMLEKTELDPENPLKFTYTAGGGEKLEGAAYFWFFTKLMLITAILFIPFAMLYKPRTYLQGGDEDDIEAATEVH